MYAVTLRTSARKTETIGYFADKDVANHVAANATGFTPKGEDDAVTGVVESIEVNTSTSVEEYQASLAAATELQDQEAWASFYEDLSDEQRKLMARFAPASLTAGA